MTSVPLTEGISKPWCTCPPLLRPAVCACTFPSPCQLYTWSQLSSCLSRHSSCGSPTWHPCHTVYPYDLRSVRSNTVRLHQCSMFQRPLQLSLWNAKPSLLGPFQCPASQGGTTTAARCLSQTLGTAPLTASCPYVSHLSSVPLCPLVLCQALV